MAILRSRCAPVWRDVASIILTLAAALNLSSVSAGQGIGPFIGQGYLGGEDVGLDDGYTQVNAFVPLAQPSGNMLLFSDMNFLLYNEQSEAIGGNLGGGARTYSSVLDRIFGGYVYYDFRDRGPVDYDQVGFGFETLGAVFDGRVNVNLPTDTDNTLVSTGIFGAPVFGGPGGQNIVLGTDFRQQAVGTLDLEGGALLAGNEQVQLKGYVGTYKLFSDGIDEWGARGRLELRAMDSAWINGFIQDDDVFGTTGGFSLEWRFGRRGAPSSYCHVASRLGDPVQRRRHIAVIDTQAEVLATSVGAPITVLHVSSNAAPGGTGGFQDPVDTLAEASNQPQDIVFVHGDSVFNGEGMQISTAGQRFLGEGVPHEFVSDQGTFSLPGVNPAGATPQILSAPGIAVNSFADNMEVSGFMIDNATLTGISAAANTGIDINRNTVTQSGAFGINAGVNAGGGVSIRDNVANDNALGGIGVAGSPAVGEISGNTANNNQQDGLLVATDFIGNISDNTFNNNQDNGVLIAGNSTFVGNFTGNTTSMNQEAGVFIQNFIQGDVTNNTANQNAEGGILIEDSVVGNITDNTTNDNGAINGFLLSGVGLGIDGNVTGNVSDNTANLNDDGGILIQGTLTGDLANNTANDNLAVNGGGQGIHVNVGMTGDVFQNVASNNASQGIEIDGVTGDVTFNTAQENDQVGILIGGMLDGDYEDNITSNNGANGTMLAGAVTGRIFNNTANDNMQIGILATSTVDGGLEMNTAIGNDQDGIRVQGVVMGGLVNNTANDNGDTGIFLASDLFGTSNNNTANDNGGNGITFISNFGTFTNNIADGNDNNGFAAVGDLSFTNEATGTFSDNTANNNGDRGYRGINLGTANNNTGAGNTNGGNTFP